tara:strand:- start:20177 stop:20458 length:282 start_codon:yes stop_codon:yes gene_type:complete
MIKSEKNGFLINYMKQDAVLVNFSGLNLSVNLCGIKSKPFPKRPYLFFRQSYHFLRLAKLKIRLRQKKTEVKIIRPSQSIDWGKNPLVPLALK